MNVADEAELFASLFDHFKDCGPDLPALVRVTQQAVFVKLAQIVRMLNLGAKDDEHWHFVHGVFENLVAPVVDQLVLLLNLLDAFAVF